MNTIAKVFIMFHSITFWQYLSLMLSIISSLLAIVAYIRGQRVNELRIALRQSQEQFQKVVLNLSQRVPIIEKDTRRATEVLKEKFPEQLFFLGFYSLVIIALTLMVYFFPRLYDPKEAITMSPASWILLALISTVFLGFPFFLRCKILESLKGTFITDVKIHFEPETIKKK